MSDPFDTLEFDSADAAQAAMDAYDTIGVHYDTSVTYRVEIKESDPEGPDPSESDADPETDGGDGPSGLPPEGTKLFETARVVGQHHNEWVNAADLDGDALDFRPTQGLHALHARDVLRRRARSRDQCAYEYRLRDTYRRDAALVDPSDGDSWEAPGEA